jgi:hypothetical protein
MDAMRKFEAHPESARGDVYVINGQCIACGAPHAVAPDLIGWADPENLDHCIWKKQPETPEELEQALAAFAASEVGCYRYAGTDAAIMERIGLEYCDNAPAQPWPSQRKPDDLADIRRAPRFALIEHDFRGLAVRVLRSLLWLVALGLLCYLLRRAA